MKELTVPCKAKGCTGRFSTGIMGAGEAGDVFSFPVLLREWREKWRCPVCGEEHWYSHNDVRDANGSRV